MLFDMTVLFLLYDGEQFAGANGIYVITAFTVTVMMFYSNDVIH